MIKSKKIVLAIIIIFMIILLVVIGVCINIKRNDENIHEYIVIDEIESTKNLVPVDNRNNFYVAKKCVEKFYTYYMSTFDINQDDYERYDEETIKEIEKENINMLYNMLDKEYIKSSNITNENLKSKLGNINNAIVHITKIYVSHQDNNIEIYVVKGELKEKVTGNIKEFKVIIKIDVFNNTFSILPQEYVEEEYKNIVVGENIQIKNIESIPKNKNNALSNAMISDDVYVKDIFNQFKNELQNFQRLAYDNLNNEYRSKRFGTFEEFQIYIKNRNELYSTMQLDKYQKTVEDNYTQYVCIDQYGNYYIFRENSIMDYEVILDTYTIDLPEFTEKYNGATEQQKVALNIDKFIQAINANDYTYAYNCLADSYKNNYFKTQEVFENYAKENFYVSSTIAYKEFEEKQDVYTYSVILTDEVTGEEMNKTFICRLGKETEFELSFDR